MEWVELAVWILALLLALVVAREAIAMPAFGVQAAAAVGGLVLTIVFLVSDGPVAIAWVLLGVAVLAAVALAAGVAWLVSDDRSTGGRGDDAEVADALLAGFLLPLFGLAAAIALMMSLDVATIA